MQLIFVFEYMAATVASPYRVLLARKPSLARGTISAVFFDQTHQSRLYIFCSATLGALDANGSKIRNTQLK